MSLKYTPLNFAQRKTSSVRRLKQMIILKKEVVNHTIPPVYFHFQICISRKVV